eukprot:g21326.t1
MAEVGAGVYGIWAIRAARAFLRFAPPEATCDVLIVEPLLLDRQLLQEHADRNLPPNRCRVIVVEAFVVQPKDPVLFPFLSKKGFGEARHS